jgi:hypothetical protein
MTASQPAEVRLLVDGVEVKSLPALRKDGADWSRVYNWESDGKRHWVRAELVDAHGDPITLTNPIYLNWVK